ncbi:MAG: hypothetical protein DRO92_01700, partial [Candidatus Altiarchaeales archaeon]
MSEKDIPKGLIFVALIFIIRGIYWAYTFSEYFEPPWEFGDVVVLLFILVFSGFYIIPAIGIYRGRRYGYYLALFMLCIEIPLLLLLFSIYTIGIILAGLILALLFYLILQNRSYFKEFDRTDRYVILGMVFSIFVLLLSYGYLLTLPTPEEYYKMISKEAKEKGDWSICDKLRDGVFWVKGWESLAGYRSECIKDFAIYKSDPEMCKNVPIRDDRNRCYLY